MKKFRIICVNKRILAAAACVAAAVAMFWVVNHPAVVGAAAATRQLPIYCVQKDYKVLSITFDAAWGDVSVRRCCPILGTTPGRSGPWRGSGADRGTDRKIRRF